jgi:predicted nucleotidyltransferase
MVFNKYLDKIFAKGSHIKILRVLVSAPGKEWSERELAAVAGVDHKVVSRAMPLFVSYKLVNKQQLAKANIYRLNHKHHIIKQLQQLFKEEQIVLERLAQKLAQGCARNKHILSATLFGSVARGAEAPGSDIDLMIVADREIDLKGLFEGAELEFGHAVAPHIWRLGELRKKRNLALFRDVLKEGRHIHGKRLEELAR